MDEGTVAETRLSEPLRNDLLRRVDWRFLLAREERPRALDLTRGRTSQAVRLISEQTGDAVGAADLAVIGFPRRRALRRARSALRPGGGLACHWRLPVPGGAWLARRALRRGGFDAVRLYWPGPLPWRHPQFWLSLDGTAATAHLLDQRPARNPLGRALRLLWRLSAKAGALAPFWALAEMPSRNGESLAAPSWLLLSEGSRSINKAVGLTFKPGTEGPTEVFKFARTPEGDEALDREAEVLRFVAANRPQVEGVPRIASDGRRGGRRAVGQTAMSGKPLSSLLDKSDFQCRAERVTDWLITLAGNSEPRHPRLWWERLVGAPLADLERDFAPVLPDHAGSRAREALEGLGPLPEVVEHRDCSPWNVLVTDGGAPALLDWESAEPRGLPCLDLVYFLANCLFRMESAYEPQRTLASYRRLLDPNTDIGSVASRCLAAYMSALGIDTDTLPRLRLLCWIIHCRSDYQHLEMEAAGPPPAEALRGGFFLPLVEAELSDLG